MRTRGRWRRAINARLCAVEDAITILEAAVRDQATELGSLRRTIDYALERVTDLEAGHEPRPPA